MTRRYGIDTSILVRLLTGDPPDAFKYCTDALIGIVENQGGELYASNQVIGEAYVAVRHAYGASKSEARKGLITVLRNHSIRPINGQHVFAELENERGAGLVDRLIANGYAHVGCETLTLDRKMGDLPSALIL